MYDVTTGENTDDPEVSVARYELRVEGTSILVGL
jgi:nitrite reductase/ring-hydroxylating ferredoxin subunit